MFTQYQLTALVTAFSLANGLHVSPRIPSVNVSAPPWSWAHDPVNCKSTSTCLSDCQAATAKICATPNLQTSNTVTLGDCTAFYWYDGGNTLPTAAQCNAAYEQITGPPSKAGGPEDCPGYVGGALGYDTTNKRTNDPVYMVYPRAGNGDCLKAPGDTSPVLAVDEIPNSDGQTLAATCLKTTSRRKRALAVLDGRDNVANRHGFKCNMESFGVSTGCSTTCLFSVTAAGWE